ncbi:MAG TPA: Gfo/Idh/MocA family oxidoreductase [Verrucomicrobiae bacterium]|jgi:predicted dehydrogenase|nr:Gfo/Idh/MocA family oxidoreductase [Verrucomicrobiae bacterium]
MSKRNYALIAQTVDHIVPAPKLSYHPPQPKRYHPKIGLIGCGGITASHLSAYRAAGWEVVALCDKVEAAARKRRNAFYPAAEIYRDYQRLLKDDNVDVVDIALHPEPRVAVIEAALNAGKHVLSQKPFVLDLDVGGRLVALAATRGCKLAVNQNGRWAPYVSYAAQAIRAGLLGEVQTVSINLNWDHTWIRGTPFEKIHHVVLYDFAIHWFDMAALFFTGRKALNVFSANAFASGQQLRPPMIGGAVVQFENGMATLNFDAHSHFGPKESIYVTGSAGTISAFGPICAAHDVTLHAKRGRAKPKLEGAWFNDGFRGAMGELLCAIEEDREPSNSARQNLGSLALCFAAMKSADTEKVQVPGKIRRRPR